MSDKAKLWVAGVIGVVATTLLVLEYLTDIQWVAVIMGLVQWL